MATFDPDRTGEFGAELIAPGSYLLERLFAAAMARGRHEIVRLDDASPDWPSEVLRKGGLLGLGPWQVRFETDAPMALFGFRITLLSDGKQEGFRVIAVRPGDPVGWEVPWSVASRPLPPVSAQVALDLRRMYEAAINALSDVAKDEVERFRKIALTSLEEEVRRIFRFFDGAITSVRDADPREFEALTRAINAERDRRLEEALERFEPRAHASLTSIRIVLVPAALASLALQDAPIEIRMDAFTQSIRGLRCELCRSEDGPWSSVRPVRCVSCAAREDGFAPLPARPPSGTPRRRSSDAAA